MSRTRMHVWTIFRGLAMAGEPMRSAPRTSPTAGVARPRSAGHDPDLGHRLVRDALDEEARRGALAGVLDDRLVVALARHDQRDPRRVRAHHLGGDLADRVLDG